MDPELTSLLKLEANLLMETAPGVKAMRMNSCHENSEGAMVLFILIR